MKVIKHNKLARNFIKTISRITGVNPILWLKRIRGFPVFWHEFIRYKILARNTHKFPIRIRNLYPIYSDRYSMAGNASGHYFHQDIWAAKKIYRIKPDDHIDVGSRIDGFISHLLVFRSVTVVDVRPLSSAVDGLRYEQGDVTALRYETDSIDSLSCLHAVEHIGLGRYGDPIDPDGWYKALIELQRILKPSGRLYLGVPIGDECLHFNAHRVFNVYTILDTLKNLTLLSFSYVDDNGSYYENIDTSNLPRLEYGCGLFEFTK